MKFFHKMMEGEKPIWYTKKWMMAAKTKKALDSSVPLSSVPSALRLHMWSLLDDVDILLILLPSPEGSISLTTIQKLI
jgi:hypothetical protein